MNGDHQDIRYSAPIPGAPDFHAPTPGREAFLSPADLRLPPPTVAIVGIVVLVPLLAILIWLVLSVA